LIQTAPRTAFMVAHRVEHGNFAQSMYCAPLGGDRRKYNGEFVQFQAAICVYFFRLKRGNLSHKQPVHLFKPGR
jgi:hypothetical protein